MAMLRPTSEMKDSGIEWYGTCPISWSKAPLYSALTEINQKNDPIVTTNILSLTNTEGVIPYSERGNQGNKSKENFEEYKVVYPNTIVANSMNILIGSVGLSAYEGCVSPVYYVYKAKPHYDIRYLNYLFSMEAFQKRLRQFANGIMEIRLRVSSHDILHQNVMIPSFEEQRAIADYLDGWCSRIDEIITEAEKSIEEYKELKQAMIFEAVTKGLDKNVKMKDSDVEWIGSVPITWNRTKISRCFDIIGSGTTPKSDNDEYYTGNINWLQSGDINGSFVTETKKHITQEAFDKFTTLKIYTAPFIAMAMYGASIANTSIVNIDACTNQACCVLSSAKEFIDLNYAFFVLLAAKNELLLYGRGGTQPNISQEIIKNLIVPIPPLKEQKLIAKAVATFIRMSNALISEKQSLIEDLKAYKKSLIYEIVTGKRRVV